MDLGSNWIRVVVADVAGTVHARREEPVRRDRDELVQQLSDLCTGTAAQAGITLAAVTQRPVIKSSALGSEAVLLGATAMAGELARASAFTALTGAPPERT